MFSKFKIIAPVLAVVLFTACKKSHDVPAAAENDLAGRKTFATCNSCGATAGTRVFPADTIIKTTLTLCPDSTYILAGKMWIDNGGKLVVPAGTTVAGRFNSNPALASALIVTRGGKLEATGTSTCPVIFTSETDVLTGSAQPGDWGGVVLLGRAPVNVANPSIEGIEPPTVPAGIDFQYGGDDPCDNSGILTYTRIQYAGAAIDPDNELNALTLGGVGSGTTLEHIETYYGADDGFEFFGGTVNAKYLLAVGNNDDQFDFDQGYQGRIQYGVSILDPDGVYSANSNGIECDNGPTNASTSTPLTKPVLSNFTIIGVPGCSGTGSILNGAHFRRNTSFAVYNSIVAGYGTGILAQSPVQSITCDSLAVCTPTVAGLFDNVVQACTTGFSLPSGSCLSGSNSYVGTNPASVGVLSLFPAAWSDYFSGGALFPVSAPASDPADYLGLGISDLNCGCPTGTNRYFTDTAPRGGAVDEFGNYWLADSWINAAKHF